MTTRATLVLGATATVLALGACSLGDPDPEDTGAQAGTNSTVAGSPAATGGNASAGTTSTPSAGTGGASGSASGGMSSSGAPSGGSAGASVNGGTGSGGGAGSGGSGGGGGKTAPLPSMGCTKPATETPNQWVESMVMTSGANRPYSVRLPTGYDPMRAYPIVMLLHGCSSGTNNVPMEKVTGADAILVRGTGSAADTCWNTGATGPDVAFFDDMVKDVKTRFCADEHR